MKKYLWTIILGCFTHILSATAQTKPKNDFSNLHVQASGTHFGNPVIDKKWSNTNGKSFTAAKFSDYSGDSYVLLTVSAPVKIELETWVELKSGTLDFALLDASAKTIYAQKCTQSQEDKTQISLPVAGVYQLVFTENTPPEIIPVNGKNYKSIIKKRIYDTHFKSFKNFQNRRS